MFYTQKEDRVKFIKLKPVQILALGFATVILIGGLLLRLPAASANGRPTPFIDCLFTSTSAVCVTGLITVDTGTNWSLFGQIVVISLIQIGGLGFMTFATIFSLLLGKKISLRKRLVIQEAYNAFNIQGLVKLTLYVIGITGAIEGIGAVLLSTRFIPKYGVVKGIYFGIFHSISAFCNAGFDLIGHFRSITPFAEDATIVLTIGGLIVLGGIGFRVIIELINYPKVKKLTYHSKVVLTTTAILIVGGAVLFFIFEHNNPNTYMKLRTFKGEVLSSIFAAITPRTAGYNSISTTDMTMASQFLTVILMFIGASPGSTGGGIKTTTFAIIFMTVIAVIHGREDTELFKRRLAKDLIYKAIAITMISFALVLTVTMILSITQDNSRFTFMQYLYETTSAFGTVGLTLGLTPHLTAIGKTAILLTMYAGRVGPLTLALAFTFKHSNSTFKYPEEKLLVG